MTTTEERHLHKRLDEFGSDLAEVKTNTAIMVERCIPCHNVVMGNGQRSLATRVTLLETSDKAAGQTISRRGVWVATVAGGVVVGLVITVAQALLP